MDFNLTEDQQALPYMAERFAAQELAPFAAKWDQEYIFPIETLQKAGELGLWPLSGRSRWSRAVTS